MLVRRVNSPYILRVSRNNRSNRGQRRARNSRRNRNRNRGNAIAAPAPFQASITFSKKFRFSVPSATTGVTITSQDIAMFLCMPGLVLEASTRVYALIDRFKVRMVEVYGPMGASLAPVTVKVEYLTGTPFTSGISSSSKLYSDTSMSSVSAAHLKVAPEIESLASKYTSIQSAVELVRFQLPANSIVDFTLDVVLNDGGVPYYRDLVTVSETGRIYTAPPTGWVSLGLPSLA